MPCGGGGVSALQTCLEEKLILLLPKHQLKILRDIMLLGKQIVPNIFKPKIQEYVEKFTKGQGRFQDFFQGVAEISSGGGENLPGGDEKNLAPPPSP